jgi:hypothetical protein
MAPDRFEDYRRLDFMESRIPVLDALSTVVVNGAPMAPEVERELGQHGQQRWYPRDGCHRVLVPYDGGEYDHAHFTVEPRAWDHDTCDWCGAHIPAMTLCWVTRTGQYVTLCVVCKAKLDGPDAPAGE